MKVIVAGAGIGGLVAAGRLADLGLEVEVYEKSSTVEAMRYNWHDDVAPKVFRRTGIEIPAEHFKKGSWTFCTTGETVIRAFEQDETDPDISIERVALNKELVELAENKGAKIYFGKIVSAPIIKEDRVVGLVVDGKEVLADLVIDSAGVYSPVRSQLPSSFKITAMPDKDEVFEVYRAFLRKKEGIEPPKYANKVYMKHLNKPGISWSLLDVSDDTCMNVLIGKIAELTNQDYEEGIADLKHFNPILSDEVVRGGFKVIIPVRYPLTRMVANGYACIGDAAFMTIPMLGSGIASSMLSATLLAETIGDTMSKGITDSSIFDAANLWEYQVKVFHEYGAQHCAVDVIKRWMLHCDFLEWLFGSKILSNDDLVSAAAGGELKVSAKMAIEKVKACGFKNLNKLLKMLPMLTKSGKAGKIGKQIPKKYAPRAIDCWENKLIKAVKQK